MEVNRRPYVIEAADDSAVGRPRAYPSLAFAILNAPALAKRFGEVLLRHLDKGGSVKFEVLLPHLAVSATGEGELWGEYLAALEEGEG